MALGGREAALKALLAYRRRGAWSDDYLDGLASSAVLDTRELALAKRLCAGVLQNAALCDFYLSAYVKGGMKAVSPVVADILRLAVYQICFLNKIPVPAAVNEAVRLTKRYANPAASGLVNAVLRRLGAHRDTLPQPKFDDPAMTLSVQYSHPIVWVRDWMTRFGAEETERILQENNSIPPVYLQRNPLKASEEVLDKLWAQMPDAPVPGPLEGGYMYRGKIEALQAFRDGWVTVQDPAAYMAVLAADPQPGNVVLDACAAPGGKSFACAMRMCNIGHILACDVREAKLRRIEKGAERLGIRIVETRCSDASLPDAEQMARYDLVLADVPCSGLGIIRKKPEIRYKTPEQIAELPALQLAIVDNLAARVRPGGRLLYSTCTLVYNENEGVICRFLQAHPEFEPEAFQLPLVGNVATGMLTLLPGQYGTDGFFICRLRKRL